MKQAKSKQDRCTGPNLDKVQNNTINKFNYTLRDPIFSGEKKTSNS